MQKKIKRVQDWLKMHQIDGWLLYDFRRSNLLACRFLEISSTQLLTRRFFYWIPQAGDPLKLISAVEDPLGHLPGKEVKFRSWTELHAALKCIEGCKKVAMEYSPDGATPEISRVDGGTIDLIRKQGCQVVSSGNLLQEFTCVWDAAKWDSHKKAAHVLDTIASEAWEWIKVRLQGGVPVREYEVQQWMLQRMEHYDCVTEHPPICAVNAHSGNPHYEPTAENSSLIREGDWILIDLWCKFKEENAVYADITRVAVAAHKASPKQQEVFTIVQKAQAAALQFVKERYTKQPLHGYEVDRVCRQVIEKAGYGPFFLHRTGHNIDESDHGAGAHLDDLETHDERELLPSSCFSIEPGIYLPEFGVRLEYDVFLHPEGEVIVTGGIQEKIVALANGTGAPFAKTN